MQGETTQTRIEISCFANEPGSGCRSPEIMDAAIAVAEAPQRLAGNVVRAPVEAAASGRSCDGPDASDVVTGPLHKAFKVFPFPL